MNQTKAVFTVVRIIAEAIRDAKVIPSGHLYAMVMDKMTLEQYQKVIGILTRSTLVSEKYDVLKWEGPAELCEIFSQQS